MRLGSHVIDLTAVHRAVRRAELRREGVVPHEKPDPQRAELDEQLYLLAERVRRLREERAVSAELYPTSRREVVALPRRRK